MVGTTLAHYEILEKLGSGGMGDVYRARDTRLDRDVALKILPAEMASDPDRRMRFEREAKAVAALNHPNIVTIHSVEEVNGTHFLTMELVEGKTLSELIPKDGMSLERFFQTAVPLAEAVTAAHAKGITHRDLKPANVMVGKDGQLKVLDFGLAKLLEAPDPGTAQTVAAGSATQEGKILGTVAYMAPEQAEGKPVDPRSDVFSLGVLLYEMATGERPFKGDTNMSTITSILRDDPPSVTELKRTLPRHLSRIVKRCLAKDPDRRYQTAHDLRNDLLEFKEELDSGEFTAETPVAAARSRAGRRGLVLGLAGAVVVILVGVFAITRFGHQAPAPAASGPNQSMEVVRLTSTGKSTDAAISGDGRYVAHVVLDQGAWSLWVTQVSTSSSVEIVPASTAYVWDPTFSPGGDFIYYCRREKDSDLAVLFRVPVLGGASRRVLDEVNSTVSFSPDGARFTFLRADPAGGANYLVIANRDGSGEQVVSTHKFPEPFSEGPAWSPDGTLLAAPVQSFASGVQGWIVGVPVAGGEERILSPKRWVQMGEMAWIPDGSGIVFAANENFLSTQLWEVSYPSGTVRRITNDVNEYDGVSLTADGAILAAGMDESSFNIWTAAADGSGSPHQVTSGTKVNNAIADWSGSGALLFTSNSDGTFQIWSVGTDGSNRDRLTGEALNADAHITPDGKRIVFNSTRGGGIHIWRMDRDGGNPVQITRGTFEVNPRVSPDGRWIVYQGGTGQNLFKIPMEGGEPVELTTTVSGNPEISPDGKWIAYRTFDPKAGKQQTIILSMDGGDPTQVLDIPTSNHRWTPDGKGIAYVDENDGVDNVWVQPLDGGKPRQLTHFTADHIGPFVFSPDGKHIALSRGNTTSDVVLLKNFR